jgi:TolB-like protein/Flp pilus assembly protein TadD
VLVVVGALVYGWQRFHAGPTATAPARLAVLPFDNASDSASGYLADGIADAIRGKLAGLGALQVIGRASSTQYRQTSKPPQLVAAELGVPYLLMGRVRSTPKPNGDRAIEIQSRLLHVVPGAAPTTIWTSSSDSGTTDVFHRESAIATNVAAALRITPTAAEAEQLADQPTRNAAAYDAFLQGEARQASSNPAFRERVILDTRAVTLDSTFGAAWAALSIAHSGLYFQDRPTVDEATAAADALARAQALDPGRPATQIALANYEIGIHHDPVRARAAAEDGLALAPDNVLLLATASAMERNTGAWDAALAHARRAELLDPRSARATFDVGTTLLYLRHYPEAIAEFDRALTLAPRAPGIIQFRTIASLCQGDTIGAHAAIARALATADTTTLVVFFATNNSLGWSLGDSLRQRMLHIDVSSFDDTASYATAKAEEYWARGDVVRARAYADTASRAFVNELRAAPQDDLLHLAHGFVLAILGRNAAAIEEGERGAAFMPVRTYAVNGLYDEQLLAQIYLIAGQPEKAIDHIAALLKIPSFLSPARLRIDPTWTPLRGNPRFQQLLASAH